MKLKDYEKVESSNIDFKEKVEYNKPKSWLKSVSAFANSNGGILLFGVRDSDRKAIGLENIIKDSEKVSEIINDRMTPLPRYELNIFEDSGLHFMERRGSGLTRIVESYNDYQYKPEFNSDLSSFKVIFPNKSYIKLENGYNKKYINVSGNIVSDEDYFLIKLYKYMPSTVKKNTYEKIQKLFDKYAYKYDFNRDDVSEIFNVKKSRASDIISTLIKANLIEPSIPTKYKFRK